MRSRKIPTDWVIDRKAFLNDLLFDLKKCEDPRLRPKFKNRNMLYLNKEALELLWRIVEEIVYYYLEGWDCSEGKIVVRPIRGLSLEAFDVPEHERVNNLTGRKTIVPQRRKFRANFSKRYIDHFNGVVW